MCKRPGYPAKKPTRKAHCTFHPIPSIISLSGSCHSSPPRLTAPLSCFHNPSSSILSS
ncbi:hypothetical protein DL95DRAFT_378047 [Leptodontidium sp. 2 PMI_412]|nr:hypothetical protein DL95DRAFT_378047 [Leptodontidium sp. 2 PMI_412]